MWNNELLSLAAGDVVIDMEPTEKTKKTKSRAWTGVSILEGMLVSPSQFRNSCKVYFFPKKDGNGHVQ